MLNKILTKKNQIAKLDAEKNARLRVEGKNKKKKGMTLNTVLTPTRRQKPIHKAQGRRVCVSTTVRCNQKKHPSPN
jgi:hypothetical protein